MDALDTRERILLTAERFYAERGFDGTSMRSLTEEAGVNLAAVNYHFGSKKALMWDMFRAKIVPLNDERIRRLEAAEAQPGGATLEAIFDALLRPMFEQAQGPDGTNIIFMRMVGRMFSENEEFWQQLHVEFFNDLTARFRGAVAVAEPGLTPASLAWRFHFAIGAMLGALLIYHPKGACTEHIDFGDQDKMCTHLVSYMCAGFRGMEAPAE
ncbi:TetR/AcrR family transcriptional regulator [Cerasicoccus maritimus]|uniref:TetR/AcrR family transcriptional regulator n=1 Tax=Cerasicoccus maritimus TaxID=490089 RepID=UPI0028526A5E|nr:TetR/AcrR family transcriptional regulator [Cerasicoccus maritimus]